MSDKNNKSVSVYAKVLEHKKKLLELRIKKSSGEVIKNNEIKELKKEIARLLTQENLNKKKYEG